MKVYKNVTELIGKTPLMELSNYGKKKSLSARVLAKLESFNPAGSAKDRVALGMIEDAEKRGLLREGSVIIEPTSGNTGIGLASVAVSRGYRVILTMPDSMSVERRRLLSAYGAEIVLTDSAGGMSAAIEKAEQIARETQGSFLCGQFSNPSNPQVHRETTGPEIWEDTDGQVDVFVCCVGTGGSITGVGEYLKSKNENVRVVAVEPKSSPLLSGGVAGAHKIQGIGANFIPEVLNRNVYDEVICVSDEDAYSCAREIARLEGILVGISSGACACAAAQIAKRDEFKGKTIVALFSDTGERYLSTSVFDD